MMIELCTPIFRGNLSIGVRIEVVKVNEGRRVEHGPPAIVRLLQRSNGDTLHVTCPVRNLTSMLLHAMQR